MYCIGRIEKEPSDIAGLPGVDHSDGSLPFHRWTNG